MDALATTAAAVHAPYTSTCFLKVPPHSDIHMKENDEQQEIEEIERLKIKKRVHIHLRITPPILDPEIRTWRLRAEARSQRV